MTLSDIRTRLQDFYGSLLASDDDFYNRVINDAYLELVSYADWWWLETDTVVKFSAPMASASILANVAATAFTFQTATSGFATAYQLGFLTTEENTYRLKTVTSTGGVLDTPFIEASGTYAVAVWNDMASLPSDVEHVVHVTPRGGPNASPLAHVPIEDILVVGPDLSGRETETASRFSIFRDPTYTSTTLRIRVFPPPDETTEYGIHYRRAVSTMANDTASSLIPARHEMTLVNMALLRLCKMAREDADMVQYFEGELERGLTRMLADQNRRAGILHQVGFRSLGECGEAIPFKLTNVTVGGV